MLHKIIGLVSSHIFDLCEKEMTIFEINDFSVSHSPLFSERIDTFLFIGEQGEDIFCSA